MSGTYYAVLGATLSECLDDLNRAGLYEKAADLNDAWRAIDLFCLVERGYITQRLADAVLHEMGDVVD